MPKLSDQYLSWAVLQRSVDKRHDRSIQADLLLIVTGRTIKVVYEALENARCNLAKPNIFTQNIYTMTAGMLNN